MALAHPLRPALVALLTLATPLAACTTAIISGRATRSGRPMLWKNRDASDLHNQVVYCQDGRYPYLGVVNGGDRAGLQVWSGVNAAGFAIMNNASYNLSTPGEDTTGEGTFMKLALQSCATVADFEALLERSNGKGRMVAANFGVIDAQGGAAYFETDEKGYRRFNASEAPGGFLVRGNYSHSGKTGKGTGYLREARAQELVGQLQTEGHLDVEGLLAQVARDTANAALGSYPARQAKGLAFTGDSISRNGTSSGTTHAFVVEGVKPGESPLGVTAWVSLGNPTASVAVPLWVEAGVAPEELAAGPTKAPLHAAFDRVRRHIYPFTEEDRCRYLDAARAYDPARGMVPALLRLEAQNLKAVQEAPASLSRRELQARIARTTLEAVTRLLGRPE